LRKDKEYREEMPLVYQLLLTSLEFSAQAPQLPLILAQKGPLV
jgi:hypothetical protein